MIRSTPWRQGLDVFSGPGAQPEFGSLHEKHHKRCQPDEACRADIIVADVVKAYLDWTATHRRTITAREWRYMATPTSCQRSARPRSQTDHGAIVPVARGSSRAAGAAAHPAGGENSGTVTERRPDATRARRATANRNLTVLKAALNHAWQGGKINGSDEAWRKVKPFRGADAARVRYLQIDECARLLNACEPDFRRLVRGALVTGCRYGELCRADVRDFNPDSASLLVRESQGR